MARPKNEENQKTPEQQALEYLKQNKDYHYNFEEDINYRVPSSSLLFNLATNGGIFPGAVRMTGIAAGGKTSCSLDFCYHFLKQATTEDFRRGVYFKAEGKLSDNMKSRSGVKFTKDPAQWTNGVCLEFESNIYETIFGFVRELIVNNESKCKYFFIIDSMDMMLRKADIERPLEDANVVAGGALITSTFLKKVSAAMSKRGHIILFISQCREEIKVNQYQVTLPRQGRSSGGHAIEHAPTFVFDFGPRFNLDLIRDGVDKDSKIIGHWCKVKILKDDNEKALTEVRYPIKYGRSDGKSVWVEYELCDLLVAFELIKKGGAGWFTVENNLRDEIKNQLQIEMPEKIQGMDNLRKFLEENPKIIDLLYNKFIVFTGN